MVTKKAQAVYSKDQIITEDSDLARELHSQGSYGTPVRGRIQLSRIETLYLLEKKKLELLDGRGKPMDPETFGRRAARKESHFFVRYAVYKDLRNRGYILKTALKFGADFRVYDRGVRPGEDHARWIVYPVRETEGTTWYEFAAKNRVAHSTKKRLMIGVVDEEEDVTYYEIKWMRP